MRCPYCQHTDTKVTDSRTTDEGNSIRRRRECINCGRRFTTYEIIEEVPLMVLKFMINMLRLLALFVVKRMNLTLVKLVLHCLALLLRSLLRMVNP